MIFSEIVMPVAKILCVLFLPGLAWSWIFPVSGKIAAPAIVLLAGSLISLFAALALAEFGCFCGRLFYSVVGGVSLAGATAGGLLCRGRFREQVFSSLAGIAVFGFGLVVLLSLPQRGEWIVGGWDPGVYANEGIAVSREGTLHPQATKCFAALASMNALEPFTRDLDEVQEAFPGFPVDLATGAVRYSFYPLTPVFIAIVYQCGGLVAAERASGIAALMALLVFAAWLRTSGLRAGRVWITSGLFVLQPVFLYHARTPCAEMLEVYLLCGIFCCLARREESLLFPVLSALTMFAAVVNHASMVLFGSLWLVVLGVTDARRIDRMRVLIEHALAAGAVLGGLLMYQVVWPLSLVKLPHLVQMFVQLAIIASVSVLLFDGLCFHERWRGRVVRLSGPRVRWIVLGFGVAVVVAVWVFNDARLAELRLRVLHAFPFAGWLKSGGFRSNLAHLAAYIGWPVCVLAVAGFLVLLCRRALESASTLPAVACFLLVATLIVLREKHAAELYPWATKRFLPFAIPLVAISAGWALSGDWLEQRRRWATGVPMAVLLGALTLTAPRIRDAWLNTEYDGISAPLAEVAARVCDNDVVVADHFQWGTPLMFVYGRQVLNGERIWARKNAAALPLLERLKRQGFRIWFLTSTDEGIGVFGFNPALPVNLKWSSGTTAYREIAHHRTNTGFPLREKTVQFRLYLWE